MSFKGLMNHKARVWRPTESRGASWREAQNTYAVVTEPTEFNARPAPIKWAVENLPAGEASASAADIRRWYMVKDAVVARFDVVEMAEGPEVGRRVRVLDASKPGNHHYMLVVEPWHGKLPGDN